MAEEKSLGIVYIEPTRILFYSGKISKVLVQDFPPDTVSNLDVVNKDKFTQILNFFIQNALQKATYELALIFSTQASFEKVLVPTISKDADALFSEFSSMVPFEEVLSRLYKENKQIKAYAVNRTFYELIADCFNKNGSSINLVLPVSLIIEKSPELSTNFDLAVIANKAESFKPFNMLDIPSGQRIQIQTVPSKGKSRRLYFLAILFAVLLVFTLAFAYMTFFAPTKNSSQQPSQAASVPQPTNTVIVTPTLAPVSEATPSPSLIEKTATKSSNL